MDKRFTMSAETFTDTAHGAEWTREVSAPLTWAQAQEYARNCRVGGHADWRLPEVGELLPLVDYSRNSPATWPELRDCTPSEWYWTATPYAPSSVDAWSVNFDNGDANGNDVSYPRRFRCVR